MPSIYELKPRFQNLLRPWTRRLVALGWTANHITLLALALSILAGACVFFWNTSRWPLLAMPFVLLMRMALNAIDGMIAREHDMKTPLGLLLNEVGDVLSDAALYLPLALVAPLPATSVVLIVILGIISEMTGVAATQVGSERRYDGPMGKSDRAFVFGVLCLALGLGFAPQLLIGIVLNVAIVLLVVTILNRGRNALGAARR